MAEKVAIFACELYFSPPGCAKLTMFCHIFFQGRRRNKPGPPGKRF